MNSKKKIIKAVDMFCGAGGFSTGLIEACEENEVGIDLIAINHDKKAIASHQSNHPNVKHLCQSVQELDPCEVVPGGYLDLLIAAPECFPAGTLILTAEGYLPIESIKVGDLVLTHKNRWRKVTYLMTDIKNTVVVKGQGHNGLETTFEHPFYTRKRRKLHRPVNRNYHRFEEPCWTTPKELTRQSFWATPSEIESLPVPEIKGRGFDLSLELLWLVGLWLAEGTVRIRRIGGEITISAGNSEVEKIKNQLNVFAKQNNRAGHSELHWRIRKVRTATLFETAHLGLAHWLVNNFGKLAKGKRLPAWVFGLNNEQKTALLKGYLQGDGHLERSESNSPKQTCWTVSKQLAYGIKTLVSTLGFRASVNLRKARNNPIEGRSVNVSDAFQISWTVYPQRNDSFDDGAHHWTKIKSVAKLRENIKVYNISVEEDESYVAESIVVHNCTHHSNARGGKPRSNQSRASVNLVLDWLSKLYVKHLVLENVPEIQAWGPLGSNGKPLKSKKGILYEGFLRSLRDLGYSVEVRILNAADYGDCTSRRRFILIASRARRKPVFPAPTHSNKSFKTQNGIDLKMWRSAAEVIDFNNYGTSIFDRKKPLSANTLKRVFAGLKKFAGLDFILPNESFYGGNQPKSLRNKSGLGAICRPYVVVLRNNCETISVDKPLGTICAGAGHFALATPEISQFETVELKNKKLALLGSFVMKTDNTSNDPASMVYSIKEPIRTLTQKGSMAVASAELQPYGVKYYEGSDAFSLFNQPLPTITAQFNHLYMAKPVVVELKNEKGAKSFFLDGVGEVEIIGVLDIFFRMLNNEELSEASGFPKNYKFTGTKKDVTKQIGNAVPVHLARAVTREIVRVCI